MNMDLKHLRQIVAIAATGNFARAAEQLSISQPALSRSVQSLEGRLGARLFDRGRSGVVPTPTGRLLLDRAHSLLKQVSEVEREIGLLIGRASGHLRVGAGPFPAAISIGSAVARFSMQFPGISIDVQVGDWDELTRRVLEAEFDLAVAERTPSEHDDRLEVEPLPRHRGTYFCRSGHPLTRLAAPRPADLQAYPLAMTVLPHRLQDVAMRRREPATQRQDRDRTLPWIHVNTFDLARQIVTESDAIGLSVPDQIAAEVAAGSLVMLDADVPGLHTNYGIVTLAGRTLSPSAEAFMQILREVETAIAEKAGAPRRRRRPRPHVARSK